MTSYKRNLKKNNKRNSLAIKIPIERNILDRLFKLEDSLVNYKKFQKCKFVLKGETKYLCLCSKNF